MSLDVQDCDDHAEPEASENEPELLSCHSDEYVSRDTGRNIEASLRDEVNTTQITARGSPQEALMNGTDALGNPLQITQRLETLATGSGDQMATKGKSAIRQKKELIRLATPTSA